MKLNRIPAFLAPLLLFVSLACSNDTSPLEPSETPPEVTITTPVDADGILNRVEANAVIVKGTTSLKDGNIVSVILSDSQKTVGGAPVVKGGVWATQSLSISDFQDGEISVTAEVVNESLTLSSMAETSLYLDQVAPELSITGPIAGDDLIAPEEAAFVVVKGTSTAADDQTVLITFGDGTASHLTFETKVSDGKWEVTSDVSALQSGSLMLMAEVADRAGNPAAVQREGVRLE